MRANLPFSRARTVRLGSPAGSPPHPRGDTLSLFAYRIGVDRGRFRGGIPHPLAEHVEGNAGADRGDPETVPQALRAFLRPIGNRRPCHDRFDQTLGMGARPWPKR